MISSMSIDLRSLPSNIAAAALELSRKISFERVIDKAGNGYVLVGRNTLIDRMVVVKFYFWGDGAHVEPRLLSQLESPNLLKVDDAAPIDDEYAYFITPYCENGDLDDVIAKGGIGVRRAVDLLMDIASGASFIHGNGFIHRDLKPSNIFCDHGGKLLIGDFGSVVKKGDDGYTDTVTRHSLLYRTPEEIDSGRVYEQSDIYQLGIVLYQLLGGKLPYEEHSWLTPQEQSHQQKLAHPDNQIYAAKIIESKITKGRLLNFISLPPWCPKELISLVRQCCRVEYNKRLESVAALMAKINNLRAALPDWRMESHPVLYRQHAKFRLVESTNGYAVEKMVASGASWRRIRALAPSSLAKAVESAQNL